MARLLYLAGPIDYNDEVEPAWRENVHELILDEPGWLIYDPSRAFTVGGGTEPDRTIHRINQLALGRASAIIAFLPDGVQTYGTVEEVTLAHHEGIPTAIVGDGHLDKSWSLQHIPRYRRIDECVAFLLGTAYDRTQVHNHAFNLKVQRLSGSATLPTRAHPDDAGFDLYASDSVVIEPGELRDIPVGIAVEPPPGYWFRIVGRSSTFRQRGLLMIEGIIDEGYRGPLYFGAYNTGDEPVKVRVGDRLCQAIPQRTADHIEVQWADVLTPSDRGSGGFGSTGI